MYSNMIFAYKSQTSTIQCVSSVIETITSVAYLGFHFGGVQNFSGKVGVFAWREAPCSAWQSHAFARGVRGHVLLRKFLKMVQFGAF